MVICPVKSRKCFRMFRSTEIQWGNLQESGREDDDLGGGSFFVEGGANGGGQNGGPAWNVNARYENNWDEDEDALALGWRYPQCCFCGNGGDGSGACSTVDSCSRKEGYSCTGYGSGGCEWVKKSALMPNGGCV